MLKKRDYLLIFVVPFFGLIILGILVLYFNYEPSYDCNLEKFGGPNVVSHPTLCDIEQAKLNLYFPLCIELVEGTGYDYEEACADVLKNPLLLCTQNIETLGLEISPEECKDRLYPVLAELFDTEEALNIISFPCEEREDCCKRFNQSGSCSLGCIEMVCRVFKIE